MYLDHLLLLVWPLFSCCSQDPVRAAKLSYYEEETTFLREKPATLDPEVSAASCLCVSGRAAQLPT